ncbi:MAG: hemerythrin domain-containing protein [Planctomycetota bacterium]
MRDVRRRFLKMAGAAGLSGLSAAVGGSARAGSSGEEKEKWRPASEELMLEHGVVHRMLLVFDEMADWIEAGDQLPSAVNDSAAIVDEFIENYHEELEEQLIFPALEGAGEHTSMVEQLRRQHEIGRELAGQGYYLLGQGQISDAGTRGRLVSTFRDYARMYRAHAAWEDTVAFAGLREVMGKETFREVSRNIDSIRAEKLGEDGIQNALGRLRSIEQALGIGNLASYIGRIGA